MHLAHKSFTKIIYLLLFIAATVLVSLLSSPSHATIQSQQLPISISPHLIQVNSDESFSFQYCPRLSQPGSELVYAHTDEQFNQLSSVHYSSSTHPYTTDRCHDSSGNGRNYTIGDDGSYYSVFADRNLLGQSEIKLAKYKNNKRHWEVGFEGCGRVNNAYPGSITEGFDGDIYAHMSACNSNDKSYVIGIKSQDGTLKFSHELSLMQSHQHLIHAYSEGITMLDNQSIRHFTYSGQEMVERKHDIQASIGFLKTVPNGTSYIRLLGDNSLLCPNTAKVDIYMVDINGNSTCIDTSSVLDELAGVGRILPDPNGGAVFITNANPSKTKNYILRYDSNGDFRNMATLPATRNYQIITQLFHDGRIDQDGNIIFLQNIRKSMDRQTLVSKIDPQGNVNQILSTLNPSIFNNERHYGASTLPGLDTDKIHLAICKSACSPDNPPYMYTLPVEGISSDYPRNLIGTAIPDHDVDADGDGLTKWQEIQQQTSDDNIDSDGDGLNDFLESRWNPDRHDLFCNGDRSVCEYPTPHEKDVYVEVDWMTRPADGSTDSYTTKPNETQIDEIKDAFDAKGIHAHFDTGQLGGGNEVPYNEVVKFGIVPSEVDFFDYKKGGDGISAQFNQDRYKIYHYMLSGYRFNDPPAPASSGVALVSDDDFFVSFGALKEDFGFILPGQAEKAITGTIIHELGHNLCLTGNTHNVPECSFAGIDANYGNDYASAMNYDKQFNLIDYSTGQNGVNDHDDWGAIRLQDFVASNAGDEEHDLLQSMQTQSARNFTPLKMQPQYRELQNKLRALEKRIEWHEDR